ncbi:MAG: flagellar export protein FliJ [Succinivibrionaceae bacterium]|nr:flagellar export protein FliJ [Succinivibrionaceae bacterium]
MANERTLRLVLEQREKAEQNALEVWSGATQRVQAFMQQIEQVREFRKSYLAEMQAKSEAGGMSMGAYLSYQDFIAKLEGIEQRQERELLMLKDRAEACRQEFIKRRQERNIIETLIQHHREEQRKLEDKRDAKLLDEVVTARMGRRKAR